MVEYWTDNSWIAKSDRTGGNILHPVLPNYSIKK